jgi:hypothetical protein
MPRIPISPTRFRWKTKPWEDPENIVSIWLYCHKGIISFEFELDSSVELPVNMEMHSKASTHKKERNFIKISNPKVISAVGNKLSELGIKGAIGKGVWLGSMELQLEGTVKKLPVYSTLQDWYEWLEYINQGIPNL